VQNLGKTRRFCPLYGTQVEPPKRKRGGMGLNQRFKPRQVLCRHAVGLRPKGIKALHISGYH